jgi:hypothetical protein
MAKSFSRTELAIALTYENLGRNFKNFFITFPLLIPPHLSISHDFVPQAKANKLHRASSYAVCSATGDR